MALSQSPHPNSNPSPHPNSNSPSRPSAFQWPPTSNNNNTDISVREIIEKYYPKDQELLKHVLMAKAEEDKRQAAQDILKTEQARIHLRQLDLELYREQSKLPTVAMPFTSAPPPPPPPPQTYYYSLAPVQQQVLARITGSTESNKNNSNIPNHHQPPASPIVYPHSAHPLCPPDNNRLNPSRQYLQLPSHQQQQQQPTTPISPGGGQPADNNNNYDSLRKRGRASISYTSITNNASTEEQDKLSHNKVMEALKAKIQRGSSSPLATTAPNSAFRDSNNKRQRTLPKPQQVETINEHNILQQQPSTPSPRSAKPILPPIDTSIGRPPATNLPSHHLNHPPLISPIKSSSPPHPAVSSVRNTAVAITSTTTTTND